MEKTQMEEDFSLGRGYIPIIGVSVKTIDDEGECALFSIEFRSAKMESSVVHSIQCFEPFGDNKDEQAARNSEDEHELNHFITNVFQRNSARIKADGVRLMVIINDCGDTSLTRKAKFSVVQRAYVISMCARVCKNVFKWKRNSIMCLDSGISVKDLGQFIEPENPDIHLVISPKYLSQKIENFSERNLEIRTMKIEGFDFKEMGRILPLSESMRKGRKKFHFPGLPSIIPMFVKKERKLTVPVYLSSNHIEFNLFLALEMGCYSLTNEISFNDKVYPSYNQTEDNPDLFISINASKLDRSNPILNKLYPFIWPMTPSVAPQRKRKFGEISSPSGVHPKIMRLISESFGPFIYFCVFWARTQKNETRAMNSLQREILFGHISILLFGKNKSVNDFISKFFDLIQDKIRRLKSIKQRSL